MRTTIMGCAVDNLTMKETLNCIESFINSGRPHQHVVVNVDKIVKASQDKSLRNIINNCDLINVDGMPVVWASKILGNSLKERVTGIDLFYELIATSEAKGWSVYFLGAREEVVYKVVEILKNKHPDLKIAGFRNGYWAEADESDIVKNIREAQPQLLFVAISSPKKEQFLSKYQEEMAIPFTMGVGGTFDVVVGKATRAPYWMQKIGLEWLYRFLQEPRRMFKRYFIDDMYFFWLLAKELGKKC